MNDTERPASTQNSAAKKAREFAAAREMADAQSRQLAPALGQHLIVIALGLLVIAFWAANFALNSCSSKSTPTTPATDSTSSPK